MEEAGKAAKLTMLQSHARPLSDDILSGGRQGWPAILSSLKSVLETGKPLSVKMAPPVQMLAALKELGRGVPYHRCRAGQVLVSHRDVQAQSRDPYSAAALVARNDTTSNL